VTGPPSRTVTVETDVPIPARDGIILRADVYRPTEGRHPVLLGRTTYGKRTWGTWIDALATAGEGYAVVVNDARGQHASDGVLDPFRTDVSDGYDVVEWCAAQPWSNGRVGMYGSSAAAFLQLQAAIARPPNLAAIAPMQTWSSFGRGCCYDPGGAFSLYTQEWALLITNQDPARRLRADEPGYEERAARTAQAAWEVGHWHARRPLVGLPPLAPDLAPYLDEWLRHPDHDAWWDDRDVAPALGTISVPALHIVGWYDRFCRSTIANYLAIGRDADPRPAQRLVIGPWPHGVPVQVTSGDRHFGPAASVDARRLLLDWARVHLRGEPPPDDEAPVQIFVLGIDRWRDEAAWPLARQREETWYLRSGGHANTRGGDGRLSREAPGVDEPADWYTYDPADPTPSVPGRAGRPWGSVDQGPIEEREDVLCYTSEPVEADTEVTGHVRARLYAATTGQDTDWIVKLVDVAPDGRVARLVSGMIRARYRDSQASATLLEPGRTYAYDIDVGPISNVYRSGHRIRIEIASASFAEYDPNLNTGGPAADETAGVVVRQTVLHDGERASHVVLPVIAR
jgi:putative CocE/NonD family hydrolase